MLISVGFDVEIDVPHNIQKSDITAWLQCRLGVKGCYMRPDNPLADTDLEAKWGSLEWDN